MTAQLFPAVKCQFLGSNFKMSAVPHSNLHNLFIHCMICFI